METCQSGHDEVVFTSRYCPVCEKIEELDKRDSQIDSLKEESEAKSDMIEQLLDEINELKNV